MVISCCLKNAVRFEPVGPVTSVFFDEKCQQVFSVRSGGATGVIVRGFKENLCSTFRLQNPALGGQQQHLPEAPLSPSAPPPGSTQSSTSATSSSSAAPPAAVGHHQTDGVPARSEVGGGGPEIQQQESSSPAAAASNLIFSIKMSPDQRVLAIQRSRTAVTFYPVYLVGPNGILNENSSFAQSCRTKASVIQGFYWIGNTELLLVTLHGVELYEVSLERRLLKFLKFQSLPLTWFNFCVRANILVASSYPVAKSLSVFWVRPSSSGSSSSSAVAAAITKLPKIELTATTTSMATAASSSSPTPPPSSSSSSSGVIQQIRDRDVHILTLYGTQTFVCVSEATRSCQGGNRSLLHLFLVSKDLGTVQRTHVLCVPTPSASSHFAINVLDNLVVVHQQVTAVPDMAGAESGSGSSSMAAVFDVALPGQSDGHVVFHDPVARGVKITTAAAGDPETPYPDDNRLAPAINSANWVSFYPDVVVDAKQGLMWRLTPVLDVSDLKAGLVVPPGEGPESADASQNPACNLAHLAQCLLHRVGGRRVLTQILLWWCRRPRGGDLQSLGKAFDAINSVGATAPANSVPDQECLYNELFSPLLEDLSSTTVASATRVSKPETRRAKLTAQLLEYLRSLQEHRKRPRNQVRPTQRSQQKHYEEQLLEMVVNLLVQNGSWYQIHQLLQYHVLDDSVHLACILLSLQNAYPPSEQLALDMLCRLTAADSGQSSSGSAGKEQVCEVLLQEGKVLAALQYALSPSPPGHEGAPSIIASAPQGGPGTVPARRFLEAASALLPEQKETFVCVYRVLAEKRLLDRSCKPYAAVYESHFGTKPTWGVPDVELSAEMALLDNIADPVETVS